MKKLLLLLPLLIVFSCSVQKRKYSTGYYVDWNSKRVHKEKAEGISHKSRVNKAEPASEAVTVRPVETKEVFASAENKPAVTETKKKNFFSKGPEDTCDVLVFKDGAEVKAKVKEVGVNDIKYKKCDTPDGPVYISRKSELFMIKYANGTREVVKSDAPPTVQRPAPSAYSNQKKYKRENHPLSLASLVLGILAIIVGYIALVLMLEGFGLVIIVLPLIASLGAIITGKTAMNRIKEQPDVFKGKGMAIPGTIMGWVVFGICAAILAVIGLLLFLI